MVGSAAAEEARDDVEESEEMLLERCMMADEVVMIGWWCL